MPSSILCEALAIYPINVKLGERISEARVVFARR